MKVSLICEECKQETLASDTTQNELHGFLVIDFFNKYFQFVCPKCGHINEMDMGNIQKKLDNITRLPNIGKSYF